MKGLLFHAQTNSEFDSVDSLFVPIEAINRIIADYPPIEQAIENYGLFYATKIDDSPQFLANYLGIESLEDGVFKMVEISEDEMEELAKPENKLKTYNWKLYRNGQITISCYGEYTGEEFWSDLYLSEIVGYLKNIK